MRWKGPVGGDIVLETKQAWPPWAEAAERQESPTHRQDPLACPTKLMYATMVPSLRAVLVEQRFGSAERPLQSAQLHSCCVSSRALW